MYSKNAMDASADGTFKLGYLIAFTVFSFWIRMGLTLELTKTFGPIIKIIYAMTRDMAVFYILYFVQLMAFTVFGVMVFNKIPEYNTFFNGFSLLF